MDSYIAAKLNHMKRHGIECGLNAETGAAQPKWAADLREAQDERAKAYERRVAQRYGDDAETSFAHRHFPLYR